MKRFAELFDRLDSTTQTSEKVDAMADYFSAAEPADAAWALAVLAGERLKGGVNTGMLGEEAASVAGVPLWLLAECYEAVGDWSETIALILPPPTRASRDESLHDVMTKRVAAFIGASVPRQREMLRDAWSSLDERSRLIFHKLIRGGLRLGVQRRLVLRALAKASGVPEPLLERRMLGGLKPAAEAYLALLNPAETQADRARAAPFMLAHQLPNQHAADPAPLLGELAPWRAEWKYDGIRAQIVRTAEATHAWSRGEELIDAQFPEVIALGQRLPPGTILDGEVVVWRDDRPAPFAVLQTHLNRALAKSLQPGLFDRDRVVFIAFDLLELAGRDMRELSLDVRRSELESLVASQRDDRLMVSPRVAAASWGELLALRASARERGVEGLMLKHGSSPYVAGRKRLDDATAAGVGVAGWWKWKLDPLSVDAVLVYAQPGSGRRAGLFTDYTFALWDGDPHPGAERTLIPFAKAYSGLEQDEIHEVDRFVHRHTLAKAGPVRTVEPKLVFEIGFEGVQESARHKSGIAVRFPRILRWRRDKTPEDADTLATLRAMLRV